MSDYRRQNLSQLITRLRNKIKRIRESGARIGEENTKATLVEPLLAGLGWDIDEPEEVYREYRKMPQDSPVDYALCLVRTPHLFIEAKSLEKNLIDRRAAAQVLGYATVVGVEWCVLTNGDEYLLYNSHAAVDADEKLFRHIVISDPANQAMVEDTLDLLAKPRLTEKRLTLLWEAHHVDRQVGSAIETLWQKPDQGFMRLIHKNARGLSPKDVKASLQRCRIRVDFPTESTNVKEWERSVHTGTRSRGPKAKQTVPGLPLQTQIEGPLLREILERGGSIDTRTQLEDVANALATKFSLTDQQKTAQTKDKKTTVWKNRIQWVRQDLIKKGDLDGSERGVWKITARGRARVSDKGTRRIGLVES